MSKVNKRYYWLRLRKDFYDLGTTKALRALPSGDTVIVIYQKLMLASLETDGYLCIEGLHETIEENVADFLGEDKNIVRLTIESLKRLNLLTYEPVDDLIFMKDVEDYIGVETATTRRTRAFKERMRQKELDVGTNQQGVPLERLGNTLGTPREQKGNTEIEKEKEKEIDKEGEITTSHPSSPVRHGICKNVILSADEYEDLKHRYLNYQDLIDHLSRYLASTGKTYNSHYHTILLWAEKDKTPARRSPTRNGSGYYDYSYEEGESL